MTRDQVVGFITHPEEFEIEEDFDEFDLLDFEEILAHGGSNEQETRR